MASLIRFRGKFKGYFFVLNLHRLFPSHILNFLGHLSGLSKWIKQHKNIGFTDYYSTTFEYGKRVSLFNHIIETEKITENIDYLEFGVAKGGSFGWWLENLKDTGSRFYGFDTFTGLPEDWGPFKKGDMANDNKPPVFDDKRHSFYQGLFQQTLPGFLKSFDGNRRKIIHMDADLYSSTLFVLTSLSPYLKSGDIIMFDEFNVPMHEYKAFKEWTESYYIDYKVLGSVNNFYQTAIMLA